MEREMSPLKHLHKLQEDARGTGQWHQLKLRV